MSDTRLIAPILGPRAHPFWLAPVCTLVVASPFALAAGMTVAWLTNPDPTVSVAQPGPVFSPPLVLATTESAAPTSTYREPTAVSTRPAPRTVTSWRTPAPVAPPVTVTRTPTPTTTSEVPSTTSAPSTTPDETSAGAATPSLGGTQ